MRIASASDIDQLAADLASDLIGVLGARQTAGAIPCVVLTGGSGGAASLSALADHPRRDTVDWSRVRFFWGDERWLPAGDPERNDKLADDTLFSAVAVDPALVHRVASSDNGVALDEAAAAYAAELGSVEHIDVAINGVGPDGHVASLFPGRPELSLTAPETPSAIPIRESPKPPPERVSLSLPALNRADRVWLIAAGASKQDAVRGLRAGEALPAGLIHGAVETVLWADEAALAD